MFRAAAKTALNTVAAQVNAEVTSTDTCDVITTVLDNDASTVYNILMDPTSYTPGTPGAASPTLNVNQYQDNQGT